MTRLRSFFRIDEMARPVGSLAKTMVAALEKARQSGDEFTVRQFCDWLAEVGVENPAPSSVGIRLSKLVTPEGGRPDALHPLVVARAGRRGPGGTGTYRYVFDGPPGRQKPTPQDEPEEEIPYEDEPEADVPDERPVKAKQKGQGINPKLLPNPVPNSDDWHEETMARLVDMGYGPDSELWTKISNAKNDVEVAGIMNKEAIPAMARMPVIRISKYIFDRMGKDWETGNVAAPSAPQAHAGDRQYKKGFQGKPKAQAQPEPEPDDDDVGDFSEPDEGDFLEPEDEVEPSTAAQAGAANFVKPDAPAPTPAAPPAASQPKPGGASAKTISQLMKRFKR